MNSIKYTFILLLLAFLFTGCNSSERKCKDVFCNYGYCQDGTCICQDEYTGSDCSQLKPPAYLTVTKVEVLRHPEFTTGGFAWDESNGRPDIYPTLSKSNVLLWTGAQKLNVFHGLSYSFNVSGNVTMNNSSEEYILRLFDEDTTDDDDFMGSVTFVPLQPISPYFIHYNTITVDSGGPVAFKVYVSYNW